MKPIKLMTSAALAAMVFSAGGVSVFAADGGTYNTKGQIEFTPSDETTYPVDPNEPGTIVTPENPGEPSTGTPGPLSIDFVSSFDFGEQNISSQDQVYKAKAQKVTVTTEGEEGPTPTSKYVPNYAQVTDNRGTEAGWKLTVIQNDDFIADSNSNHTLAGSKIIISNVGPNTASESDSPSNVPSEIILDGADDVTSVVMEASAGEGAGTHIAKFGKDEVTQASLYETENVVLEVPGSITKYRDTYKTSITWTLSDTPDNGGEVSPE